MGRGNSGADRVIQEERELRHFSHVHALQLFDVQYHGAAVCDACKLPCTVGPAYRCAPCNYILDRTCAHTPQAIRHPGHPGHTLTLQVAPTYADGSFSCDACGGRGVAFSFHCTACEFDLHISCANAPLQLHHHSHPHPLSLAFSSPYGATTFACDICRRMGGESIWLYRCAPCGFDAHVGCAIHPVPRQGYHHQQQPQQQLQQPQLQEQQPSYLPRSTPESFQSQSSHQPPVKDPAALQSQPDAIDDAVAVQLMAFYMQQAQLQNQMMNNMVQSHQLRMDAMTRVACSTWQPEEGFMSAPKVPRPITGGIMNSLMQNLTNTSLASSFIAAAAASPGVGTSNPLGGMLGQVEGAGLGGQPAASPAGDLLASLLKGSDSGVANSVVNAPSANPEEFLDNLLKNSDWIPKSYPGFDVSPSFGGFN